jgi:hypothetical protein
MSQALFAKIAAEAAAPDMGNRLRHGHGKVAVKGMSMRKGYKGETFIMSCQVLESTATVADVEPNPPGSTFDVVQPLNKEGAGGRVKALILKALGCRGSEVSEVDALTCLTDLCGIAEKDARAFLAEQVAAARKTYGGSDESARYVVVAGILTDSEQPARGVALSYETREATTKKGQVIIVPVFGHVAQTREEREALKAELS